MQGAIYMEYRVQLDWGATLNMSEVNPDHFFEFREKHYVDFEELHWQCGSLVLQTV